MLEKSNKAATYDSRVASSRQNLNAVIEIYCEGKTPGSVLCGPVYTHRCALLLCIYVYDAKKNPGGCTRYPENHWNSFFVSPKCGKRMSLTGFPNSSPRGLNLK
jgi:rubredoxin